MPSAHPDPVIRDLEIMAPAERYGRWIYSQFDGHLGQRVIECGAGIGNFTRFLLDRQQVVAIDIHDPCIEYLKARFAGAQNLTSLVMDVGAPALLELAASKPDTIVCINVLEHLEDDRAVVSRMFQILTEGGKLLLLVPAGQRLYGSMDRRLGHYRRYGRRELREKVATAGFTILKLFYMNAIASFGWFLNNRVFRLTDESPAQVMVFDRWVVPWLRPLERLVKPPFGLSLIAVAQKPIVDQPSSRRGRR